MTSEREETFPCVHCARNFPAELYLAHLSICRPSYSGAFRPCRFNARHIVPEPELRIHSQLCKDRQRFFRLQAQLDTPAARAAFVDTVWLQYEEGGALSPASLPLIDHQRLLQPTAASVPQMAQTASGLVRPFAKLNQQPGQQRPELDQIQLKQGETEQTLDAMQQQRLHTQTQALELLAAAVEGTETAAKEDGERNIVVAAKDVTEETQLQEATGSATDNIILFGVDDELKL